MSAENLTVDEFLSRIADLRNMKRRDADGIFTWEQVCDFYTGHSHEPESPLHTAFRSGRFIDESGAVVCHESYLDGWIDAYYKQKKS